MADMTRDELKELRARAIDPGAWVKAPPATFLGMQPKGTPEDNAVRAWWDRTAARRHRARISAEATMKAEADAGLAVVPKEATDDMAEAAEMHAYDITSRPKINAAIKAGDLLGDGT